VCSKFSRLLAVELERLVNYVRWLRGLLLRHDSPTICMRRRRLAIAFVSYLEWAKLIATSLAISTVITAIGIALWFVSKVRSASSIGFFALDQVLARRWHRLPIMSIEGAFDIFVLIAAHRRIDCLALFSIGPRQWFA
jgi:hypothetical protein